MMDTTGGLTHCVYILFSRKDGKLYTGYTSDLSRRLTEHHQGRSKSTACRRPLVLLKAEFYRSESDARRREAYLKTTAGKKGVRLMLQDTLHEMKNMPDSEERELTDTST
jgi:putative endonuclease